MRIPPFRRLRPLTACAVALALLPGLVGLSAQATNRASSASHLKQGLEGIPRFDHVVVLTEENESESTTFGATSPARYLNSLVPQGVFLGNYYGTGHASLDNYIAMVSGQPDNPASAGDCEELSLYNCAQIQTAYDSGRNLADQLEAAHVTWKSYMDSTPSPCFHGPYSPTSPQPDPYQGDTQSPPARDYADRHNPFVWFPDFVGNQTRCEQHQLPFTQLGVDLQRDALPQFAFITPDTCHDGHDNPCSNGQPGGLVSADAWLKTNLPPLLDYLWAHHGLLIINFDENGFTTVDSSEICTGCASGGAGGRVGAILLSPILVPGRTVATDYDHFSLLRTIEDSFGISEHLNLAGRATPMTDAFTQIEEEQ